MIGIYVRQSLDKKDSISIESQIEFCQKEFNDEEYKVYTDKGYSGKDINRPAFTEMIRDIKSRLISKVIVYKLDRISRSVLDFSNIIDIFGKHGVDFISTKEKFDTSTPIGKAMLSIIMVFAELERSTIQMRIKDNYYARGRRGFFMGGTIPYGFTKVKTIINGIKTSTFEPEIDKQIILENIYNLYAYTNKSLGQISDDLNNKHIHASKGGKWDSSKISRMIRSPLYVKSDADVYMYYKNRGCIISNDINDFIGINGCYLYGKRESNERKYTNVTNHILSVGLHEGFVDSKTWLLCQYKLDSNKQIKNSGKGKHTWLSGIVKCDKCGYAVSVVKAGHGDKKYFSCRGRTNLKICDGFTKPIKVNEIENIVKLRLLTKLETYENEYYENQEHDDINTNKIKLQLMDIDNKISNLLAQISEASGVTMKYINEKIDDLDRQKQKLLEEQKKSVLSSTKINSKELIEKIKNWNILSDDERKEVAGIFISKVLVKEDSVRIQWVE
jgi:site-specific DNA recombinase